MNLSVFLHQIYGHAICTGPSNRAFSGLRYTYYANRLKYTGGPFKSATGFYIQCPENVSIGREVFFNRNVFLACIEGDPKSAIEIGDCCLFGPNVVVVAGEHDIRDPAIRTRTKDSLAAPIVIEEDCWIGANATVTAGVCIGRGSVIGANSVVTRDIPEYVVAAGTPARVIRARECQS